jgi:hypothetical protein
MAYFRAVACGTSVTHQVHSTDPTTIESTKTATRSKHEGESYNDVLERVLGEDEGGDVYDGLGRWLDEEAERVHEQREQAKETRNARMRQLGGQ